MSEKIIGRIRVIGSDDELTALTPFVTKADQLLGRRYDPFRLETRQRYPTDDNPEKMPIAFKKEDGTVVRSRGHWSERLRRMLISKDLFQKNEELLRNKTLGHEFVHVLFSDWLGRWHRRQLLPLITPPADNWNDETIGDDYMGYVADPNEALACYGSAALFGWAKPAYSSLYVRSIIQTNYPQTKAILLATAP